MLRINRSVVLVALTLSAGTLAAQAPPLPRPAPPPPATPAPPAAEPTPPPAPPAPEYVATRDEALTIGRETVQRAYTNQIDALLLNSDPVDGDTASMRRRLADGLPQILVQLGAERRMIREQVMKVNGRIEYWRTAEYELVPVPLIFRVIMGAQGKWRGFTATVEEQAPAGEELLP